MEALAEEDPFASIIGYFRPTASQEAKLESCLLMPGPANFMNLSQGQFSSSSSSSVSSESVNQDMEEEEESEFVTPPEHQFYDQNPNEGLAIGEAGNGSCKVMGLDDEPEAKRARTRMVDVGDSGYLSVGVGEERSSWCLGGAGSSLVREVEVGVAKLRRCERVDGSRGEKRKEKNKKIGRLISRLKPSGVGEVEVKSGAGVSKDGRGESGGMLALLNELRDMLGEPEEEECEEVDIMETAKKCGWKFSLV